RGSWASPISRAIRAAHRASLRKPPRSYFGRSKSPLITTRSISAAISSATLRRSSARISSSDEPRQDRMSSCHVANSSGVMGSDIEVSLDGVDEVGGVLRRLAAARDQCAADETDRPAALLDERLGGDERGGGFQQARSLPASSPTQARPGPASVTLEKNHGEVQGHYGQ